MGLLIEADRLLCGVHLAGEVCRMQTLSENQLIGQVVGTYRIERFTGKSRLNTVYLVRQLTSQKIDALTVYTTPERFTPDMQALFLQRFLKEAAVITALDHPHILPVYVYGELANQPYLVTPYTTQGSLADRIKQQGRCNFEYVGELLLQIVSGLDYAHQRRIFHGTLKPANIVLQGDDMVQVAGFGLLNMLQRGGIEPITQPYAHLLSVADTFLAAPEYIAPEIVLGKAVDARSDVYSLGCILYELLSGRPPFTGPEPFETAQHHVQHNIPSLRALATDVPVAIVSVVHQALERDPDRRFQSIGDLEEAFAQASQGAIHFSQALPASSPRRTKALPTFTASEQIEQLEPITGTQATAQDQQRRSTLSRTAGDWQLVPPIVTGRIPVVKVPAKPAAPYIVPAPPTLPPPMPQEKPADVKPMKPMKPEKPAAQSGRVPEEQAQVQPQPQRSPDGNYLATTSFVGTTPEQMAADAQNYAWWSPEEPKKQEPQASRAQGSTLPRPAPRVNNDVKAPAAQQGQQGSVRLPSGDELNWMMEPSKPAAKKRAPEMAAGALSKPAAGNTKEPKEPKVKRRRVVALLAAGALAVSGTGAVFALEHGKLGQLTAATTPTQPKALTQSQQLAQKTQKPAPKQPAKPVQKQGNTNTGQTTTGGQTGHTGTPVGSTKQGINTAVPFTNPKDGMASLLIHLPNGNFVAYERACTHQGVSVNYNPATQELICPLHGATFDAKNQGAVLVGPATLPLPRATIHVNTDGTITVI